MVIDTLLIVFLSAFVGLIIGILAGYFVVNRYLLDKITYYKDYAEELEDRLKEWKGKYYGIQGNEARKTKNERMQAAMLEAMALIQQGKPVPDVLKEVSTKYPDVAMDLMKKQSNLKL